MFLPCSSGGIGRHVGLKIQCPLGRAGSSPALSTKPCYLKNSEVFFVLYLFFLGINLRLFLKIVHNLISC